MIPLTLTLTGFLSYRESVTLDFTAFDLACIAGANGAGKSSLLDAITYALFGQARKRDDSLINTHADAATVELTFAYEGNRYRVQRTNRRGKSTILEFHIAQIGQETEDGGQNPVPRPPSPVSWKPLTEKTIRSTQARLEETLRLDYETFVNAAFFLQGKADQFTQQRPAARKRILASILGLETWETYRRRAAESRKTLETHIHTLEGRLSEITAELREEPARRTRLKELEKELDRLEQTRAAQENALENMRKNAASVEQHARLVQNLARQLDTASQAEKTLETRLGARRTERETHAQTLSRADAIQTAHQNWQQARQDLERWEQIAEKFREHEKRRAAPLTAIETERARLQTERAALAEKREKVQASETQLSTCNSQLTTAQTALAEAETQLTQRAALETQLDTARQQHAEAKAENPRLRDAMHDLRARIDQLEATDADTAACPLCSQPLPPAERAALIAALSAEGTDMGDRYRANKQLLSEAGDCVKSLQAQIGALKSAEAAARRHARAVDQLQAEIARFEQQQTEWDTTHAPALAALDTALTDEAFALKARAALAEIDTELEAIGYAAAEHDRVRRAETEGRASAEDLRALERAQAALEPLDREIAELDAQLAAQQTEVARQQAEHDEAAAALAAAQADLPDLPAAERQLLDLMEDANRVRLQVGAAQQKVAVLGDLRTRRRALETERDAHAERTARYKTLERAFGKDGVPALLIEQALPQIEDRANVLLDRLSNGDMSVRFITQREYKDKKREDLRETLDIQISDSAGVRDYEMFSGGEAFRVNFAIRLALSEILAQRAGARLQTLVIDEGFGSQDAAGRQRLIEAINMVRDDFAKILVITHIDELKDAFPTRIEVRKDAGGSRVEVV